MTTGEEVLGVLRCHGSSGAPNVAPVMLVLSYLAVVTVRVITATTPHLSCPRLMLPPPLLLCPSPTPGLSPHLHNIPEKLRKFGRPPRLLLPNSAKKRIESCVKWKIIKLVCGCEEIVIVDSCSSSTCECPPVPSQNKHTWGI
ncbi:hypothetical protein E2C01_079193 [Portunus trituberculatus]|uniref:Uncharacterized protein n=1 Tax=Portunus trituberculatus TaxID=210409 RepID=A0A5B7IPN4_PORTR|nr:hypothetical protein [Portunus trituberculatus]